MIINDVWKLGKIHAELTAARTALDAIAMAGTTFISFEEMKEIRAAREVVFSALDRVASKMDEAENDFENLQKIALGK